MKNLSMAICLFFLLFSTAQAQNTGGVFPPGFGDNHESAQYRIAINTDTDRFANRIHYQKSIDSKRLWRVLAQSRETAESDFDFDFIQAELFWELGEAKSKWRKGLRFDARLRDENRPGQIGVNFMNQWTFDDGWSARLVGLSNLQIGKNRRDGIAIIPRARLAKKMETGASIGIEYFGSLGTTEDISLKGNSQTVGPFFSTKLVGKTSILVGAQFGINETAPDTDLRLWLTQGF